MPAPKAIKREPILPEWLKDRKKSQWNPMFFSVEAGECAWMRQDSNICRKAIVLRPWERPKETVWAAELTSNPAFQGPVVQLLT